MQLLDSTVSFKCPVPRKNEVSLIEWVLSELNIIYRVRSVLACVIQSDPGMVGSWSCPAPVLQSRNSVRDTIPLSEHYIKYTHLLKMIITVMLNIEEQPEVISSVKHFWNATFCYCPTCLVVLTRCKRLFSFFIINFLLMVFISSFTTWLI